MVPTHFPNENKQNNFYNRFHFHMISQFSFDASNCFPAKQQFSQVLRLFYSITKFYRGTTLVIRVQHLTSWFHQCDVILTLSRHQIKNVRQLFYYKRPLLHWWVPTNVAPELHINSSELLLSMKHSYTYCMRHTETLLNIKCLTARSACNLLPEFWKNTRQQMYWSSQHIWSALCHLQQEKWCSDSATIYEGFLELGAVAQKQHWEIRVCQFRFEGLEKCVAPELDG